MTDHVRAIFMRFQCDHVTVTVQMRMRLVERGCRFVHDEECDVEWCRRVMWFVVGLRGGKTLFSHMSTTEKASGNFYMFGAVKLENPRYVFGPHPMTTAVFDGLVPCFALNDDNGSVVGTFEHYNDTFVYEVPCGTYHISAKVGSFISAGHILSLTMVNRSGRSHHMNMFGAGHVKMRSSR